METFNNTAQRFFDRVDKLQKRFAERWAENANRRTLIVLIIGGSLAIGTYWYGIRPPDAFPIDQLVTVKEGESISQTAHVLKESGVVRSEFGFKVAVLLFGRVHGVRAGDYMFKEPEDLISVARAISTGAYGLEPVRIRIPEGATAKEMAVIYGARLPRFNAGNFTTQAVAMEGFLYPDTYFFLPNATEDTVIQTMRQNFDTHWNEDIAPLLQSTSTPQKDYVIMASIIEREASNAHDRQMISGVLWNRIKKNMPLQVDVTFLYTIGKGTYQLTMKDLRTDNPYNTYVNKGLPPGAIGSPSLDSLKAAVKPIPSDYLFYLADRSGTTYFSKTFQQHAAKKDMYVN
jgi:UPF0755 protein